YRIPHIDRGAEVEVRDPRITPESFAQERREMTLLLDVRVRDVGLGDDEHPCVASQRLVHARADALAIRAKPFSARSERAAIRDAGPLVSERAEHTLERARRLGRRLQRACRRLVGEPRTKDRILVPVALA